VVQRADGNEIRGSTDQAISMAGYRGGNLSILIKAPARAQGKKTHETGLGIAPMGRKIVNPEHEQFLTQDPTGERQEKNAKNSVPSTPR